MPQRPGCMSAWRVPAQTCWLFSACPAPRRGLRSAYLACDFRHGQKDGLGETAACASGALELQTGCRVVKLQAGAARACRNRSNHAARTIERKCHASDLHPHLGSLLQASPDAALQPWASRPSPATSPSATSKRSRRRGTPTPSSTAAPSTASAAARRWAAASTGKASSTKAGSPTAPCGWKTWARPT